MDRNIYQDQYLVHLAEQSGLSVEALKIVETRDYYGAVCYMTDIIPIIQRDYSYGVDRTLRVLDVGAKTAAGTALLAHIHHPNYFSAIKMEVTALDLQNWFQKYALLRFPSLKDYIVGDIFDLEFEQPWDIIVTSHTVEHIPNANEFIERLKDICCGKVYAYTPYNETVLCTDHCITWDDARIAETNPSRVDIITNVGWKHRGDCVLMTYDGRAQKKC